MRVGDVVVFNFPYSKGEEQMRMNFDLYFCKRCVAIPGETYIWEWDAVSDSVYLPRQEEVVVIDSLNFRHYNRCIEYETGIMPKLLNGTVMHADTLMHSYRFKIIIISCVVITALTLMIRAFGEYYQKILY